MATTSITKDFYVCDEEAFERLKCDLDSHTYNHRTNDHNVKVTIVELGEAIEKAKVFTGEYKAHEQRTRRPAETAFQF